MWQGIVELSEGRPHSVALEHVASCSACARLLEQMKSIMDAVSVEFFDAPEQLIDSVIGLMPSRQERTRVGLIRSTLAFGSARADSDDFQVIVGHEEFSTRLMVVRNEQGWDIVGKLPEREWRIERDGVEVPLDADQRFSVEISDLSDSAFSISSNDMIFDVPSLEDLLRDGSNSAR